MSDDEEETPTTDGPPKHSPLCAKGLASGADSCVCGAR